MFHDMNHLQGQRGAVRLGWVAFGAALLAALGMAALASIRSERNLFAEAAASVAATVSGSAVADTARQNMPGAQLRKCVIKGKTVVSNVDCKDDNPSSRALEIRTTRGVEAPRVPVAPPQQRGSQTATDKMIEKQLE